MEATDYQKLLLKEVDNKLKGLSEMDVQGVLWWGEFKKFIKEIEPVSYEPIDFNALIKFINKTFDRGFRKMSPTLKNKYIARLKEGYTKEDIMRAIVVCKNHPWHIEKDFEYCDPLFFAQEKTLIKYGAKKGSNKSTNDKSPVN